MATTRTYWLVETIGGPGNSDCRCQSTHDFHPEAAEIAERVKGRVWHVSESTDVNGRTVRTCTEDTKAVRSPRPPKASKPGEEWARLMNDPSVWGHH